MKRRLFCLSRVPAAERPFHLRPALHPEQAESYEKQGAEHAPRIYAIYK